MSGFVWEIAEGVNQYKCVRDCTNTLNSNTDYNENSPYSCICLNGFDWNNSTSTCDTKCGTSAIPNSVSLACADPFSCLCKDGYIWDDST